jgi:hypothetical protein
LAAAMEMPSIVDVALMLALLAAFASVAFIKDAYAPQHTLGSEGAR